MFFQLWRGFQKSKNLKIYKINNIKISHKNLYKNKNHHSLFLYRSCIALFYRKRLPQQQRDRRIGERETSTHCLHVGQRRVRAIPPFSPPSTCDKKQAWVHYSAPPPPLSVNRPISSDFQGRRLKSMKASF